MRARRIAALAAVLAIAGGGRPAAAAGIATVGSPAPPFLLDALGGRTLTLAQFHGHPLMLNVFASWCPPCREELPGIVRASRRYRGRVAFVGVDEQEPVGAVRRFVASEGMGYTIAVDSGPFESAYGAAQIPTSIFVDRQGIVRAIYRGPIPEDLLNSLLARLVR